MYISTLLFGNYPIFIFLARPRSPPMLIDMRNNQLVTKDSWKSKVPNSEESDSRSQMSQSPDSLTSFSLRLSDDEEEIEENENTNINMRCDQQTPEFPKSKMENNIHIDSPRNRCTALFSDTMCPKITFVSDRTLCVRTDTIVSDRTQTSFLDT